ncbi:MAG: NAD(P)-binding protein, partial [Clostridiales bacterium]|nr:NAD(P)-binding protein [Clostridiales bacterium]
MLADAGYSVTCFEMQSHIGGRLFEDIRPNGIRVQVYGPQIFHTDNENVFNFLKRFASFYPYRHRALVTVSGKTVPLPLNAHSFEELWGKDQASLLLMHLQGYYPDKKRISADELIRSNDKMLIDLGRFIIENILTLQINRKEAGSFDPADDSYMNDAKVDVGTDDCYYEDAIQSMPIQGFTELMEKMLDHPGITTYLNMDAMSRISILDDSSKILLDGVPFSGPVIYTPPLDLLFGYRFGALPYRTRKISFSDVKQDFCNESAVILSPQDKECIRITESKHITLQDIDGKTTLCSESPYYSMVKAQTDPFEPEITADNKRLHGQYMELLKNYTSLIPLGHLACYKNMSIADSIEQAMQGIAAL